MLRSLFKTVGLRLSLASVLTALVVLAAPAASALAQPPDPVPAARTGEPQADVPAEDEAPGVPAQPMEADAILEADNELAGPSPERAAALSRVAQIRRDRAVRRRAAYEQRRILQAHFALVALQERQLWLAQQASFVGTPEYSSSSYSSPSYSDSSCSGSSRNSTVYYPAPSYSAPMVASSPPASSPPRSTASETSNAMRAMAQRYKP